MKQRNSLLAELRSLDAVKLISLAFSVISAGAFARFYSFSSANITTLLLALLSYPFFIASFRIKEKRVLTAGVLLGVFFSLTHFMIKYEWLIQQENHRAFYALEFSLGFTAFYTALSSVLLSKLQGIRLNTDGAEPPLRKRLILFFVSAAVMFFCWLPYFKLSYPCVLTNDSIDQLNQAVKDRPLSNHHPVAHTFIIRLCYNFGFALFHDETKAVATYSIIQMLFMAFSFSYLVVTLYRLRVKKLPILCVFASYAVLAYHGTYSITMWKDVPFGILVLTLAVTLWRILLWDQRGQKKTPVLELIMLFLTGIGVCLFRSNGLVAYAGVLLFLLIYCLRKKKAVTAGIACTALVLSLIVKGPVYSALQIKPPETIEGLGIPQQMIGRVLQQERPLTDEQIELISGVADIQALRENYWPGSADGIKYYIWFNGNEQFIAEHKKEFFKLWVDLGLKYPSDYLIAYVSSTNGYWYPDVQNWIYGDELHTDNFETLHHEAKLSEAHEQALREWRNNYHDYYIWGLLWSIAAMFWLTLFMTAAAFVCRKKQMLLLYLPVIFVWGTLMIAAPVYAEFRYTYSMFCSVPMLCLIPFVSAEKPAPAEMKAAAVSEAAPAPEADVETAAEADAETAAEAETESDTKTEAETETKAEQPEQTPTTVDDDLTEMKG
ncbi:MAG: hypothetical protein IKQ91_03770 [Oscillospiraceae bacterium]|nr:hypothetical protein [Oscillospiraceae bacterium]